MLFTWNEQSIRWFLDASEYTGFHRALAGKLAPYLAPTDTLLDAGCGLGRLDLELAPYVAEILAVDISELTTNALRQDAALSGLRNLRVRRDDASEVKGGFDVVLLSFFGQSEMMEYLERSRRRLIRIVSAANRSGLYPERHRRNMKDTVPIVRDELTAMGIGFRLELHELEFGQPLRSREDAGQYILKNAPKADPDEIEAFLSQRLEHTGREDFPLYLPNTKELGIFIIDKEN